MKKIGLKGVIVIVLVIFVSVGFLLNRKVQERNFLEEGVLLKNNPGLEPGAWYLSFEMPGSPGLTEKLYFNNQSICLDGKIDCNDLSEEMIGERVIVEGFQKDDKVLVYSLTSFNDLSVEEISERWIKNHSPTYSFDGEDLELVESRGLDLVGCENCYEVEYRFDSRHAGYGDRTGEALAQVITSHNTVVFVEDKLVTKAVTDGVYNEITGEFLDDEEIEISLYFIEVVGGQEQLVEVKRNVSSVPGIAQLTIELLLEGPLSQDGEGVSTAINEGVKLQNITIEDGIAKVDFNEKLEEGVAGSAWVTSIRSQIENTLKQFDSVDEVVISVNGRVDDILQP